MIEKAFKGVYRRIANDGAKECHSEQCPYPTIGAGEPYARVLRHDDRIEMFHEECFANEFGEALHA